MKIFLIILLFAAFLVFLLSFISKHRNKHRKISEKDAAIKSRTKTTSQRIGVKENKNEDISDPKVKAIFDEGTLSLNEMTRLYKSIDDPSVKEKINEIMFITDRIMQDAKEDPSDIPQIKKFFSYYLPTTIKLLNAYDRMSNIDFESDNADKTKTNINEMLDVAIEAYKKRLDSLFENQAVDIETDIDVMNQMLAKEGLVQQKGE